MTRELNEVVVIDAVRTAFGRAGEKGLFWNTRAEDLCVPLLKALIERNPAVQPAMIEDSIWGVTNQVKEQGGTIGRMTPGSTSGVVPLPMAIRWRHRVPGWWPFCAVFSRKTPKPAAA